MKISKLYELSLTDRRTLLKNLNIYDQSLDFISDEIFDSLIENYVTTFEVPMGLVPNYLIDDKDYNLVIATEEPSVIAASSNAAKIIGLNGGFKTKVYSTIKFGQIVFQNVKSFKDLEKTLKPLFPLLKDVAKKAQPEIYQLGGGINSFLIENNLEGFACMMVFIDTVDAMGANTINTILEAIASYIKVHTNIDVLMAILSNDSAALVEATCIIDPNTLPVIGAQFNICNATRYAQLDKNRAVTHNKGIMNGISGIALATGNDVRSIEAAAHSYASSSGSYQPLSSWTLDKQGYLIGKLLMPLSIGTVGGATSLPKAKFAQHIMNYTNAKELMSIMASAGLASNFAALLAVTTVGIQKGHMKLHNRSKNNVKK